MSVIFYIFFFKLNFKNCIFFKAIWRQAVKKKIAKKRNNKKENPEMHEVIKQFIALAFLPKNEIEEKFYEMKRDLLIKHKEKIRPFLDYYQYTWIQVYKVETFCVYGEVIRTNNSIEAYHRVLNSYLKSSLTASAFLRKKLLNSINIYVLKNNIT